MTRKDKMRNLYRKLFKKNRPLTYQHGPAIKLRNEKLNELAK